MKKMIIVTVIIVAFCAFYFAIKGPMKYEAVGNISEQEFECAKSLAHVTLDNPIERILLYKVEISKIDGGQLPAKAYYPVGIPYSAIWISKNCEGARRWR